MSKIFIAIHLAQNRHFYELKNKNPFLSPLVDKGVKDFQVAFDYAPRQPVS